MKRFMMINSCTLLLLAVLSSIFLSQMEPAYASTAGFNPGRIIDDTVFTNNGSMSASQIQSFLNSRNSVCLRNYQTPAIQGNNRYGSNVSAATAIKQAADLFKISPQVLLATLEKEQGIVTRSDCPDWRYRTAMGFGCPDTAPCDAQWFGLSRQLYQGARHFRGYFDQNSGWFIPFTPGTRYIQYNPSASCGGKNVSIQNRATASLYSYTPYQPNTATLAAAPGQSVACGAYGNLNFWRYFNNWFGSPTRANASAVRIDGSSDKTGKRAVVGLRLNERPRSSVRIELAVSSPSNASFVDRDYVIITPGNWDRPENNTVQVAGRNNSSLTGAFEYSLVPRRISSSDTKFNLNPGALGNIHLVQLDTASPPNVYRLYSESLQKHLFTASSMTRSALIAEGWRDEGVRFYYCYAGERTVMRMKNGDNQRLLIDNSAAQRTAEIDGFSREQLEFAVSTYGTVPVYWLHNSSTGNSLYSTNPNEASGGGWQNRGIVFNACENNTKPIYRLYRPSSRSHLFTVSPTERDAALKNNGFRYEGLGFYVCGAGEQNMYRLYRRSNGNHFYTISAAERDKAVAEKGFRSEGVKFKLCNNHDRDIYRLYNPQTTNHLFTPSAKERQSAASVHGFRDEGVRFQVK